MRKGRWNDPYFKKSIAELEALVEQHRDDRETLATIAFELQHRDTDRASKLKRRVTSLSDGLELPLTNGAAPAPVVSHRFRVRQAIAAVQPAKAADDRTISPPLFTESEAPVHFPDQPADPALPPVVAEPITSEPRVIRPDAPSTTRKLVILDPVRVRMLALIDYVIAVEKDKLKPVTDIADHKGFHEPHEALRDLPGVTFGKIDGDDMVWLHVERLTKRPPPHPDDALLSAWLLLTDAPGQEPKLRTSLTAKQLEEAGIEAAEANGVSLDDFDRAVDVRASFDAYIHGPWTAWSNVEAPRRKTVALYSAIFTLRQTMAVVDGIPMELVCGIAYATLLRGRRLRYPLLTVPMEIELDARSQAIELRPRLEGRIGVEADPLDIMALANVDEWRTSTQAALDALNDDPLSPFAPETYLGILQNAVAVLDPDARLMSDEAGHVSVPSVGAELVIADAFGFFQRERRATQLMDDLRVFRSIVEDPESEIDIPPAIAAFFTEPSDTPPSEDFPMFRGVSSISGVTSSDGGGEDLFFPKPFNGEQVQIVQRLAVRDGVVVQGPPGTGKTHTIANIISHYLAKGKRVLVTSQKSPALKVLREQLPEAVRPLAVSLLDSDREGLKQFQASVDTISERLQHQRRDVLDREIATLDNRINGAHRLLAVIDREVDEIGRQALSEISIDAQRVYPLEAAREIVSSFDEAHWLDDPIDDRNEHDLRISEEDFARLREARLALGDDIFYLGRAIPDADLLSNRDAILDAHVALIEAAQIEADIATGAIIGLRDKKEETLRRAIELERRLLAWRDAKLKMLRGAVAWQIELADRPTLRDDPVISALGGFAEQAKALDADYRHFVARPVELPDDFAGDAKLAEVIVEKAHGGVGLGRLAAIFAGKVKAKLAQIKICGEPPTTAEHWAEVLRYCEALTSAKRLAHSWNHACRGHVIPTLEADGLFVGRDAAAILDTLNQIEAIRSEGDWLARETKEIMAWRGDFDEPGTQALLDALAKHSALGRLAEARGLRQRLSSRVARLEGDIADGLKSLLSDRLGLAGISPKEVDAEVGRLAVRLAEIHEKVDAFAAIERIASLIAENGAPIWAKRLERESAGTVDPLMPSDWRRRWRLRRLVSCLARSEKHDRLRELHAKRGAAEADLRHDYTKAIEARTWLELKKQATSSVLTALAEYGRAVSKIGRGTGKSANRHRKAARRAADGAKSALPCWIMPHYRVSESLPAELAAFDLVIVDEASQSTISALPVLFRAKQILVVGDDKQVSPDNVGREMARADMLANRHLAAQVALHAGAMREESSLYDLASVIFGADKLMLREHFRCAAPLIEFSKRQFYRNELKPLRLSKASERLDPPLIDILVTDGYRKGKINPPEADCIIDQLRKMGDDEAINGRSIGITTLLGTEQAAHIYKKVENELGINFIERFNLRVGDPTVFQGDERDIMLLSLVASPGEAAALSGLAFEQRFNVAASRARERMILVRSVALDQLSPKDTLRRALLEHFVSPFPQEPEDVSTARGRCESDFEREMFDVLVEHGFAVETQVRVGTYRIDIVVEGDEDRRLGIECDGDRYHGPAEWPSDMQRQRTLERAGWTIWRCFASRFVRERDAVVAELLGELKRMSISPRPATARSIVYSQHHTWSSVGNDDSATDTLPPAPADDELTVVVIEPASEPEPEPAVKPEQKNDAPPGSRMTETDIQAAILHLMSDGQVWTNAELKSAIDARLPLSAADRSKSPSRPNEEKWEELVNNALTQTGRSNSLYAKGLVVNVGRGMHRLRERPAI
jgi:very-short-patch-repair endonuclease